MSADFLIAYDVTQPRRLQRLHRFLLHEAIPIQYSVFFINIDVRAVLALLAGAKRLIDPAHDDLRCYPLPKRGLRLRLGKATLPSGIYYSELPPEWMAHD